MIIGTCGFSWSGSSAVADFLAEFNENQVYNDDEFIIAFFPDGIEDLDYNLNTKCSKFVSSTVAIPRFRKVADLLLRKETKGKIQKITDDYIKSLVQAKWTGSGQGQAVLHNPWMFNYFGKKIAWRCIRRLPVSLCKKLKIYPLDTMEYSIQPDKFYEKTIMYTDNILKSIGLDLSKNIVLDQPFPGNNPVHCMKYFRESRAIVVDRDPRDLYILAKEYYPHRSYQIPYEKVEDFVSYYYNMHKNMHKIYEEQNVLCIKFEELVFEYNSTANKIIQFLGLRKNMQPKRYFQPERSMVNTRLFKKCTKYANDIEFIESSLNQFLFDFDRYSNQKGVGEMFDENPPIQWRDHQGK